MARLRDSWRTSLPACQQPRNPQPESIARNPYYNADAAPEAMTRVARATRSGPRSPTCRAVRSQGLRFRGADGDGRRSRGLTARHFSEEGAIRSRTATHPSANPVRVPDSRAADIVHIGLVWRQSIHVRHVVARIRPVAPGAGLK